MKAVLRFSLVCILISMVLVLTVQPTIAQDQLISQSTTDCSYGGEFKSIAAVDKMTVKFVLCAPDAAFLSKIAFQTFSVTPAAYLQKTGGKGDLLDKPIGTGPYKLEKWDKGNQIILTRFDDYWGDKPKTKTVVIKWTSDASARLVELRAGTADGIDNVAPPDFDVISGDPELKLYTRPALNVMYLGMNNTIAPFDNVKFRQAIAYGVDRQRIVDNFYPKGSTAATQFVPPAIFGFTKEVEPFAHDVNMAKKLIAESGVQTPVKVTLSYRNVVRAYLPQPPVVAQDIQAQLKEIGVEVELREVESGAFITDTNAGKTPFFLLGWSADWPDATNFLDYHFGAGANPTFGKTFKEITEPLAKAGQSADPAMRYPLYVEANKQIRDLVPMVPIANGGSATAFKTTINGAQASPLTDEKFAAMENTKGDQIVFIQGAESISMYCPDETDGETFRVCGQISEGLYGYEVNGTNPIPRLATACMPSADLLEWTCKLRDGVKFHDGSTVTANDVALSYIVQWDAANPLHTGRVTQFSYMTSSFGGFLNAKK
jgi:peptide/nickel transport system substrate-binding protein